MQVKDAMSQIVLSIGPRHTLREASQLMTRRSVGAAVVMNPDTAGIGILTERDVLRAIGGGLDPDTEAVEGHLTADVIFASPTWPLVYAAEVMTHGGFRHLIVLDGAEVAGIISVRDIVRHLVRERALAPESG